VFTPCFVQMAKGKDDPASGVELISKKDKEPEKEDLASSYQTV